MSKRPSEHIRAQKAGRVRDHETCQICGSTKNVQGHHMIEYQHGGAADSDNIVSLCEVCHRKVHAGKIDIYKF